MSAPVRVVGVATTTDRRGAEMFASHLRDRLQGNGFDITVVAMGPGGGPNQLDFQVLGAGRSDRRMWQGLWSAAGDADVLVAFGGPALLPVSIIATARRVPFVYRQIGDPSFWGAVRLASLRIGAPMRRAAGVVALWRGAADDLARRYRLDPARVQVIPNGRDAEHFRPPSAAARAEARRELGLGAGQVVAYLGALAWEKRPADAIEAVARVPEAHLVLAGDGPLRAELEELAASVAPGRVHFQGVVADPRQLLAAADVLICTSATEGMAGCLLEAALSGLPVVATQVGSAAEVVDDGTTGRLIPVDDAAAGAEALEDVLARAATMGAANRARAEERFALQVVVPRWAELLASVAARTRR